MTDTYISPDRVERAVQELIRRLWDIDCPELSPHTDLRTDLGADSLDMVELVVALGCMFDLNATERDLERVQRFEDVRTVGHLITLASTHGTVELPQRERQL